MKVKINKPFHQFEEGSVHDLYSAVAKHLIADGWAEAYVEKPKRKPKKDVNKGK